jgi:pSer/pThr/pTyr-binding forkhead associated (FHA) protein
LKIKEYNGNEKMKRPPVIIVQLVHISGPLKGKIQEFSESTIPIGRSSGSLVRFPADLTSVSRDHADIIREGNQFKLVDHSKNATFVNGKMVKDADVYLKNGDVLIFAEGGPKVSFLTQMKEAQGEIEKTSPPPIRQETSAPREIEPFPPLREPRKPEPIPQESKPKPVEVSPESVKAPLIIQYGPTLRSFKELPITIGRNPKSNLILDHPAILDNHAQIFFSQNQYWVKDLTGQRLLLINRQPVSLQAPLQLNDDLSLSPQGPVFRFLGEGRLIEVTEPLPSAEASGLSSGKKEATVEGVPRAKDSKKRSSLFKKLFDH